MEEQIKEKGGISSTFQRAKDFVLAMTTHIASGGEKVTDEVRGNRLSVCRECPLFIKDLVKCSSCGCYLDSKTWWATAKCPEDKWLE